MNIDTQLKLSKFSPRPYQLPLCKAFSSKEVKRFLCIWPRRCLSGFTHIIMSNGSYKLLKDLQVGDEILSWDGSNIVKDKVKNIWNTDLKKTYIVKGAGGLLPLGTSNDHVFAYKHVGNENISWKKLSDLPKKALLLNYAGIELGKSNNPDLAEFLGYMLSDGYVSHYQQPKFTNTNLNILKRVEELTFKLFGYKAIWREKGNGFDLGLSNGTKGGGAFENKIKELFRKYNCDVSKNKRKLLPIIWDFDEESILKFLAGYLSGDGSLFIAKNTKIINDKIIPRNVEIVFNTGIAEELGWGIYWLLRKIGIVPQVPYYDKGSNLKIRVSKRNDVKKLLKYTIIGKEEKQKLLIKEINETLKQERLVIKGCYQSKFQVIEGDEEKLFDIETELNHNFFANGYLVHNSGKDVIAFNLMAREAYKKIGVYYYIFPTYSQARKVIWDSITNNGEKFLDYIPKELVANTNSTEMKISLINGSLIQLCGSDNYDNLMGTNPIGIIFSEYALQDPMAYQFLRPILLGNDGWAMFISTPRAKNHLFELYEVARNSDDWFCSKLTIEDTDHIPLNEIQKEIAEGLISEDLVQQEYYTSFDLGVEGSYYSKYLDRMRIKGQIGIVPWEPAFKVYTAWDLGVRDSTSIIFFQIIGQTIRIIDCYEKSKEGLEHYVNVIESKPYSYAKHIAPHDIKVQEFGSGITRIEKARQLGIKFTVAEDIGIQDGIECVRSTFAKIWIDEVNCQPLIKALESYRQEYDSKRKIYKSQPLHDFSSHFSDAMRYLCVSLPKTRDGLTPEKLEQTRNEAIYGTDRISKGFFREDVPEYM